MDNYKVLEGLLFNLRVSYIFYIPKSIIPKEILDKLHPKIINEMFDQIVGLNKQGTPKYNFKLCTLDIVNKQNTLKENIINLLEAKVKMDATSFNYIVEEFKKHLESHLFISKWLSDHLLDYFPKEGSDTSSLFHFHFKAFDDHHRELVTLFQLNAGTTIKRDPIQEFQNLFLDPNTRATNVTAEIKSGVAHTVLKPIKEITDQEIDFFLLDQVFGISPKHF